MLAKEVATEIHENFIFVPSTNILRKFMEEPELLIKDFIWIGKEKKPAIIFFDEIDCIMSEISDNKNEVINRLQKEFLIQMQDKCNDNEE